MSKFVNVGDVKQTSACTWEWTIKDFRSRYMEARVLYSANISIADPSGNTNWFFRVYPSIVNEVPKSNYLGVFIENIDKIDVTANFVISVILSTTSQSSFLKSYKPKEPLEFFKQAKCRGVSDLISHDSLKANNQNGILRIEIQISVVRPNILSVFENYETNQLEDDFEKLFHSEKHTDVTFNVSRKKIHLHKAILSSRSPYFEAMFEHDMKENVKNIVKITDTKLKIFKEMCRYIYAGRVNDIANIAKDLFIAADKYCIDRLRNLCEKIICNQVNSDNALEYLVFAKTYNTENLESKAFECIKINITDIYEKPEFKELDPEIKDEIIGILIGKSKK